jgi:hypothetical protein
MPYAILLSEQKEFDLRTAADILAKAKDFVLADATFRLRNGGGVLLDDLPLAEAQQISNELNNAGIGCFHMDMKDFYNPPQPYTLQNAHVDPEFFGAIDLYGNIQPYFWRNIVLVSCGFVGEGAHITTATDVEFYGKRQAGRSMSYGFGSPMGRAISRAADGIRDSMRADKKKHKEKKVRWLLDIFLKEPQEKQLRIVGNGFNYNCLGDEKVPHSLGNFITLIKKICSYSQYTFSNRGVTGILADPPQQIEYDNEKLFDAENFWLLQLVYLNLNQDGPK